MRLIVCLTALAMLVAGRFTAAGDLSFKRHVINADTDYSAAALMDVNHDGQIDIICGGDWYEGPNWTKHFVADIPRIQGRPDGYSHLVFDVNRDGWMDVISVNWRSRSIKWMEHPGASLGKWTTHIAVEPGYMESGRLLDIDNDGQLDLLPNGAGFAAWWEFRWNGDGPGEPAWIRNELPPEAGGHGMGFGDIDGDGRGDIIAQNGWLRAPEDRRNGHWEWHPDYTIERGSIPMLVVDPDEDGDNDIVWSSAHGFGVYWLEQVNVDGKRQFVRHAIDTDWSQGHSPLWADLDGDGHAELITGKRYMAHGGADPGEYDPIALYRYQYNQATKSWDRWVMSPIGERVGVGLDPKVADIDGDGDLDFLASGRSGLYWLENLGPRTSTVPLWSAPEYPAGSSAMLLIDAHGKQSSIADAESFGLRRAHIVAAIERAHGSLPSSAERLRLDTQVKSERADSKFNQQAIMYQIDATRRAAASLFTPNDTTAGEATGVVCLFDPQDAELAQSIAGELAERGFVCVVPELLPTDSMIDGVWQATRAADLLQACPAVHGERIAYVGNALNGELGIYLSAMDQRFIATLSDVSNTVKLTATSSG
ncbi:MAG: VCBS repeat-containing protein, partial [bacterium]|nr:VCBS repeat-containing protein [bacterium]